MKKIAFLSVALIALGLASCGHKTEKTTENTDTVVVVEDSTAVDQTQVEDCDSANVEPQTPTE